MLVALLMSVSLAAGPTAAPAPASPVPPAAQELKPGERRVKVVCRDEVPTGSRFAKRKCMAVDDMERRQELTSWALKEMQRNHNIQWGCDMPSPTCK